MMRKEKLEIKGDLIILFSAKTQEFFLWGEGGGRRGGGGGVLWIEGPHKDTSN